MREILFKAKAINRPPQGTYRTDYKNGDWVYGLVSELAICGATMTNTDGVSNIDVDKNTICEWTGLTDRNGTKIFEGDIVRAKSLCTNREEIFTICWDVTSLWFGFKSMYSGYAHTFDNLLEDRLGDEIEFEVIGNVHDNPELLGELNNGKE